MDRLFFYVLICHILQTKLFFFSGLLWGLFAFKGFIALALFCIVSSGVVYAYALNYQVRQLINNAIDYQVKISMQLVINLLN